MTIAKCLTALEAQVHLRFEIIVVDDQSSDDTLRKARSFQSVKVIAMDWGGPSRARNIGVAAARGEIVAFTDADCVAHPDWLTEIARCFDDPGVAGAGGDQVSPEDETPMGRRVQEFFKAIGFMTGYIQSDTSSAGVRETTHNPSCNSAYRKRVFEAVGGFSEDQFPGEDVELDLKLRCDGYKLVYNPAAIVGHYRPRSLRALASMMRRYGAGERRLVQKYGFLRRLDFLPFGLALGAFLFAIAMAMHSSVWPLIFSPWLLACGFFWAKTKDVPKSLQFTLFLTITVASWNWGFIKGNGPGPTPSKVSLQNRPPPAI
jgi:GT2 family glycosyltransferase